MFIVTCLLILQLAACAAVGAVPNENLHITSGEGAPDVVLIPGLSGCGFGFRQIVPQLEAAGLSESAHEGSGVAEGDGSRLMIRWANVSRA